jgi:solute carrier family 50 protein (sugar transporter)
MIPPVVVNFVFPLIGTIICQFLWTTPVPAVLEVRYTRYLGPLNPYVFVVTCFNCVGWSMYAAMTKDIFIFLANLPGICLGLFNSIQCLTVMSKKNMDSEFSEEYLRVE